MAIWIQKRSWKNRDGSRTNSWRLVIDDYSGGDRISLYPKKSNYRHYGFDPEEPYESAMEKLKSIQAQNRMDRLSERRAKIEKRIALDDLKESAFIPRSLYGRFLDWLKERRLWDQFPDRTESHLRCMRNLILEVNLAPDIWADRPEVIFRWFLKKKLSVSYLEKVLPLLNAYGFFYCREFKKPFLPIPSPRGELIRRIEDANLAERNGSQDPSKSLTPSLLLNCSGMLPEQYRWMRISLFFGLRPSEIDALSLISLNTRWKVSNFNQTPVLWVYQHKLIKIERERRWKRIPAILPEQRELIQELRKGSPIARPLLKTIRRYLGDGFGAYAGRKGFEALMRENGQSSINISRWLGHQDIRTTERHYRETEAVYFDPIGKTPRPRSAKTSRSDRS